MADRENYIGRFRKRSSEPRTQPGWQSPQIEIEIEIDNVYESLIRSRIANAFRKR